MHGEFQPSSAAPSGASAAAVASASGGDVTAAAAAAAARTAAAEEAARGAAAVSILRAEQERDGDEDVASVWAQVHENLKRCAGSLEHYATAKDSDLPCCLDPRRYKVEDRGAFDLKEETLGTNREEVKKLIEVTASWTTFEEVAYRQRRVGLLQAGLIGAVTHALVFEKAHQVETFVSRFTEMYSTGVIVAGGGWQL